MHSCICAYLHLQLSRKTLRGSHKCKLSSICICVQLCKKHKYILNISKKVTSRNPQKCRPLHGGWFCGFRGSQSAPKPHQWTQILQVSCNANCTYICITNCICICIASMDANTPGELCCKVICNL